jgi:hypothetical protein
MRCGRGGSGVMLSMHRLWAVFNWFGAASYAVAALKAYHDQYLDPTFTALTFFACSCWLTSKGLAAWRGSEGELK